MQIVTEETEGLPMRRKAILDCVSVDGTYYDTLARGLVKWGLVPGVQVEFNSGLVVFKDREEPYTVSPAHFRGLADLAQTRLSQAMSEAERVRKMRLVWQELGRW